ncbi:MAG: hypothetical protein ACE15C_02000 [Phycisphaerae bacterium]
MRGMNLLCAVALVGVLLAAPCAMAQDAAKVGVVSNVKVLSDKCEDVSSPEAWKKSWIKEGMSDQEKAIAIWKTVVKYRHQTTPPDEFIMQENVHDPIKVINVYGYGMCCCAASNVEGLARYVGLKARGRIIAHHSVPEVWYDDSWHLLDCSIMNYFIKPDGKIASVDELRKNIQEWFDSHPEAAKMRRDDGAMRKFAVNEGWKKGPSLLADCPYFDKNGINGALWHGWMSTIGSLDWDEKDPKSKGLGAITDYGPSMGYKVNVQLREGEKLTRCWYNKGLVVNGADKDLIAGDRKPLGLQKELGDNAPGRIGNGVLEYAPPMASLPLSALTFDNLAVAGGKLRVKDASKPGTLVIRMPTSYVYLTGSLDLTPAVGEGGSVTVLFSDNHGLDWKEIGKFDKAGEQKIDLKKLVFRRYDYRLKFVMAGAGSGLDAIRIAHDVQHSQAPLPVVLEGDNKITFTAGPQDGTITYEGLIASKSKGNLTYLDFHPVINGLDKDNLLRVPESNKGDITFTLSTPGDMTRIRLNSHYRCRDMNGKDYWLVEVSYDGGKNFKEVDRLDKAQPASSKYITIADVPAGTREAQVRLSGAQNNTVCMFDLRIDADYKEPNGGFAPVKVTYVWEEDGQKKTDEHVCKTAEDAWTIKCGPKTVAKSFTVELAK